MVKYKMSGGTHRCGCRKGHVGEGSQGGDWRLIVSGAKKKKKCIYLFFFSLLPQLLFYGASSFHSKEHLVSFLTLF